jgi:hypothetical protein
VRSAARADLFNLSLSEVANSTHRIELKGTTAGPSTIGFDTDGEVALLSLFDADTDGHMSASELHTLKWMLSRLHESDEVRHTCQRRRLCRHRLRLQPFCGRSTPRLCLTGTCACAAAAVSFTSQGTSTATSSSRWMRRRSRIGARNLTASYSHASVRPCQPAAA